MADIEKKAAIDVNVAESSPSDSNVELGRPTAERVESDVSGVHLLDNAGKVTLVPQPSDDPADPLNWSWFQKHLVLLSIIPGCFLTDMNITWGSTLFVPQAIEWHRSVESVSHSLSGGTFMAAPGGLFAVLACQRYGRLPILFWSSVALFVVTIGATVAEGYAGFTACRTLQGFFGPVPQVVGLPMIHDMFFFHERARKINIWAFSFLIGPYFGPLISTLIADRIGWRDDFWVLVGFCGLSTLSLAFFCRETLYDRKNPGANPLPTGLFGRLQTLVGISGVKRSHLCPPLWTITKDLCLVGIKPYMILPAFFICINIMFAIGLVSCLVYFILPPPYLFSNTDIALLFFAPMVGIAVAEVWGHWYNDFIMHRYLKRHDGKVSQENRLWGAYPPWIIGIAGYVTLGEVLQHDLHWIGIAFAWGMTAFSMLGTTTPVSAYALDCFPKHSALAAAWLNVWRVLGGFTVTYYQFKWVALDGAAVTFGCQAAIMAASIGCIVAVQIWGKSWRQKYTVPAPEN